MEPINRTYRIMALFMAIVLLTSTLGFSINIHYCQDRLKSFSLFGTAKNCHEMAAMKACPHHEQMAKKGCGNEEKGCCDNKSFVFKADQTPSILSKIHHISPELQQFLIAYVITPLLSVDSENTKFTSKYYKPPLIIRDIPVFIQSFLL